MPEMTRYEHGVPSWVDIGMHDLAAGVGFYTALFGWTGQDTIALKDGKQVAAIAPAQDAGPPRWTTYVNVDDVDEVARTAEAAGGKTLGAPMGVLGGGRGAMFTDT